MDIQHSNTSFQIKRYILHLPMYTFKLVQTLLSSETIGILLFFEKETCGATNMKHLLNNFNTQ